jgi:hypothetical protein
MKPIVMEPNRIYHPIDYTVRGMIMDELKIMWEAHDTLENHSPGCEVECVLESLYKNHIKTSL